MALKKGTYKVPKGPKKILNKVSQKTKMAILYTRASLAPEGIIY